jgi:hypothetical protein
MHRELLCTVLKIVRSSQLTIYATKSAVNLWNGPKKKATNADIDILEIRVSTANPDFDYNRAIAEVANELFNDTSSLKELKSIPVIIKDKIELDAHSIKILENTFSEIKNE